MYIIKQKALNIVFIILTFIVFIAGRVRGVSFKMLFLSHKNSRAPAREWAAGTCHSCNISGKKDEVGRQALPQRAPQASSAGLGPLEKETQTPKAPHPLGSRSWVCFLATPQAASSPSFLPPFLGLLRAPLVGTSAPACLLPALPWKMLSYLLGLPVVYKTQDAYPVHSR